MKGGGLEGTVLLSNPALLYYPLTKITKYVEKWDNLYTIPKFKGE